MAFALNYFCVFSIFGLSTGTVFVEDRLYPDYEQRRFDVEDRLPFAVIPSGKREIPRSHLEEKPEKPFAPSDYIESPDVFYLKEPFFYDAYDESYNQYSRKSRNKADKVVRTGIGRIHDKPYSKRNQKNKYKGNVKDHLYGSSNDKKQKNLSKPRHSDVLPDLNEISV